MVITSPCTPFRMCYTGKRGEESSQAIPDFPTVPGTGLGKPPEAVSVSSEARFAKSSCGTLRIGRCTMEPLLTIQEAAEKLGVKPNTLYLWVSQRRIPHRKIGRLVRFRDCDLEEFVEKQLQPVLVTRDEHL